MISGIKYIGKETNMLDEREAGMEDSDSVYLEVHPDEWENGILPILMKLPHQDIAEKTGLSRRQIIRLKQGKHHPYNETLKILKSNIQNI